MHFDKLVIGADLDALRFAYTNKYPILYYSLRIPPDYDLEGHLIRYDEYRLLLIQLGFCNLNPFSNLVQSIRIEDTNILKVATKNNLIVTVTFNHLYIGDDNNIQGLPPPCGTTNDINLVLDYMDVNRGLFHPYDKLENCDDLVKIVYFYLGDRFFFKNFDKKDCVALSLIKTEDLTKDDYAEYVTRTITKRIMKGAGIKGKWDKTNNKFKGIKLTSRNRQVFPLWKNVYNSLPSNIEMLYNSSPIAMNKDDLYVSSQDIQLFES